MNNSQNFFNNYQLYLIGLLPACFIAGPAIIELILLTLFINFCIDVFYLKKNKLELSQKQKYILKTFFLFYIFIIISSVFSDLILVSMKVSIFYLRYVFYAISIFYYLQTVDNKYKLKIIYIFFSSTLLILIIDAFIQVFNEKNIFGQTTNQLNYQRISGLFGGKFILGSFLQN